MAQEDGSRTIRTALLQGRELLSAPSSAVRGESEALDAEVLLGDVLGMTRTALLTHPEQAVGDALWERYQRFVERRAAGEPVAYLIGRREFMGLEFAVDERVLIPRPETELLVESALAHVRGDGSGQQAVDVGTGSGAIAISLAVARPELAVLGIDISKDALVLARANARRLLGGSDGSSGSNDGSDGVRRVRFARASLLELAPERIDVVVSNLPYITTGEVPRLPISVRAYEPRLALDGGPDGLDLYRALLPQTRAKLRPGGALLMECDPRQAEALAALAAATFASAQVEVHHDLAGRARVVEVTT